jgi:hypothetical protein
MGALEPLRGGVGGHEAEVGMPSAMSSGPRPVKADVAHTVSFRGSGAPRCIFYFGPPMHFLSSTNMHDVASINTSVIISRRPELLNYPIRSKPHRPNGKWRVCLRLPHPTGLAPAHWGIFRRR